ncbi:hypothetical protein Dsin_020124 [Dipteronia sinensis]|uniref:RING-type domain-containing protein n=1 Tax=Dipteronia sinensis TaxID=43782 RepID=A0AAE0A9V3_9ROSI|nr:hypothetical protein Dsin_020124 [Dipteronia sinensis]
MNKNAVEIKALIEGLNAALSLELTDYFTLYQVSPPRDGCDHAVMRLTFKIALQITGKWPPKQRKIAVLVNQVHLLYREFQSCNPVLVARNDLKYGLKLERDAIVCQTTLPLELSHGKIMMETCVICLEDTDVGNTFSVDGCLHRYCFSCMGLHVEDKLLHAMVPKCPHDGCLKFQACFVLLACRSITPVFLRVTILTPLKNCLYTSFPCSFETDALSVVSMVKADASPYAEVGLIIHDIQLLLNSYPDNDVDYVPRKANMAAYSLAKLGLINSCDSFLMEECPPSVAPFVTGDCPGSL